MKSRVFSNGVPIIEIDLNTGKENWIVDKLVWEQIKKKILDKVSESMSIYTQSHPESALWNT